MLVPTHSIFIGRCNGAIRINEQCSFHTLFCWHSAYCLLHWRLFVVFLFHTNLIVSIGLYMLGIRVGVYTIYTHCVRWPVRCHVLSGQHWDLVDIQHVAMQHVDSFHEKRILTPNSIYRAKLLWISGGTPLLVIMAGASWGEIGRAHVWTPVT